MSDYIEFALTPRLPSQRGTKVLDGKRYNIWIRYGVNSGKWIIDITSMSDSAVSIKGKALLQGKDLLATHGYGDILGELWLEDTAGTYDDPTYDGFADRWRLRYYPRT